MSGEDVHGWATPHRGRPLVATVEVPGSKSITNRALVCAALADGDSELVRVAPGDDTVAMIDALGRLGITVDADGPRAVVAGRGGRVVPAAVPARVDAGLAGTTSRFATAVASLAGDPVTVDGAPPLRRRPMGPLHDALAALGVSVIAGEAPGHLPVTVTGPPTGGRVALAGDVSSQYVTALMLIAPRLPEGLVVDITTPLVSRPYVELTATVMAAFGANAHVEERRVRVPPGAYTGRRYEIEPDASSASYPLALAAVLGGEVTVAGLHAESLQGDRRIVDLLEAMGCRAERGDERTTVARAAGAPLLGIDVDLADASDLVPTVAAVAVLASTPTRIRGVGFIRAKESDRIGDLARELGRLGADVRPAPDGLDIDPAPLHGAVLDTHHDHRLAMAFAVIGAAVPGVRVRGREVVSKSWPAFWDDLAVALDGGRT